MKNIKGDTFERLQAIAPKMIFQDSYGDGIAIYDARRFYTLGELRRAIDADIIVWDEMNAE